jgi:hypothetical protein
MNLKKTGFAALVSALLLLQTPAALQAEAPVSEATSECLSCHESLHPGIVADWRESRHAASTPSAAMKKPGLFSRVSARKVPDGLADVSVGCAECHLLRPKTHADTFDHLGHDVHIVVSPDDCAACHPVEAREYGKNLMSHARKNLLDNKLYFDLRHAVNGTPVVREGKLETTPADAETERESCFHCHGSRVQVSGHTTRETDLGEMEMVILDGWPNQGVGRRNPDESLGACTACHTRHAFSVETARKPHTCNQCHSGPDVPVGKVYDLSKHGNIYASQKEKWDFGAVPWVIGENFTAPTCATCHISLLVNTDGDVVAPRTHEMAPRLARRLFGLIYAHPHPKSPDTTHIVNTAGIPLPTEFSGKPVMEFLISPTEQKTREEAMQAACLACHAPGWVGKHFRRLENTVATTNASVLAATDIMSAIWREGYAQGIAQGENPFDEAAERDWTEAWLFFANSVRFASAMSGGGEYGVFADGRHQLAKRVRELDEWLAFRRMAGPGAQTGASGAASPTPAFSETAPSGPEHPASQTSAGAEADSLTPRTGAVAP